MLNRLIAFSLSARGLILAMALALVAAGIAALRDMPLEVFPELKAPTVTVMTESHGFAAEEVETSVTFPLESAVHGLPGLRRVRSSSTAGLSIVWVEFDFGVDIYRARQLVAERLAQVQDELPANVDAPEMGPVSSIAGEILLLAITSPDGSASPLELRRLAEFDLRPRILSVAGVAQVTVLGGELPEYQVLVRPLDLQRLGLALADVEEAVAKAHAPVGGGYLADVQGRELPIRPQTRAEDTRDLSHTVVGQWRGTPVTVDRVADVEVGGALSRGAGSVRGQPAAILAVQKSPDADTLAVTRRVDELLTGFEVSLPENVRLERQIFRQADFIEVAVTNVLHAVRDGALFVVLVLVLFLLNLRTTLITLTALPMSLLTALLVLDLFGETVNVMTLGGIAVAVGSLVDDAIVDVENVYRRLRQNAARPPDERLSTLRVVYVASVEVRPAIVLATLMIVLFFVPLFFLSGVEGRFFRPLGLAYIVALGASLLVAMTLTPVLCSFLLGTKSMAGRREGPFVRWLHRVYGATLARALVWRRTVLAGAGALVAGAVALGTTFGTSFLPDFNEGSVTVFLNTPPGTSLAESGRLALQVERRMQDIPGVVSVARRTGRGERDEHAEPVSASEIDIRLAPGADVDDLRRRLVTMLGSIPGLDSQLGGPIAHRLSHILSGTPAAVAIKIFGDDLEELRAVAAEVVAELRGVPGVRDLVGNREVTIDTLPLEFDRAALARYGLTAGAAAHQVETAFLGRTLGIVTQGSSRMDVVVRLHGPARGDPADVREFVLRAPSGALVRLGSVAEVREERAANLIARENVKRKAVVSCNVAEGHNLGDLVEAIRERVDPIVARRAGMFVEYGGQFEAQQEASRRILWTGAGVLLLISGLLYASFRALRPVLLILLNLPLALVGGVVALYLDGSPDPIGNLMALFGAGGYVAPVVSIPALVGFIGLAGVACRNGLLLLSHTYDLMQRDGLPTREAIVRGAQERVVPILMTALSSALALIPLAVAGDAVGNELQHPLAVVILGGLVSSTFLNLVVIPAGLYSFGGKARPLYSIEPQDAVPEN